MQNLHLDIVKNVTSSRPQMRKLLKHVTQMRCKYWHRAGMLHLEVGKLVIVVDISRKEVDYVLLEGKIQFLVNGLPIEPNAKEASKWLPVMLVKYITSMGDCIIITPNGAINRIIRPLLQAHNDGGVPLAPDHVWRIPGYMLQRGRLKYTDREVV